MAEREDPRARLKAQREAQAYRQGGYQQGYGPDGGQQGYAQGGYQQGYGPDGAQQGYAQGDYQQGYGPDGVQQGYAQGRGQAPLSPEKKPKFWARRKKLAVVISCIVVVILILKFAPVPFGTLSVEGSKTVTRQDVITAGQIREPINILQISTTKLQERLRHDLRIESVTVSYGLPAELKVRVVDRKAVAVAADQFGYIAIDKTGTVISSGPAITDTSVPIISGMKLGNVLLGDRLTNKSIQEAITFLTALSPEGQKQIAEVNVGNANAITAYTVDGVPLRLGEATDMAAKAKMADEMLSDTKKKNVTPQYYDVNLKAPFIKQ